MRLQIFDWLTAALFLAWRNRSAGTALTLALLFPATFIVLFIGAVIAFSF